MTGNSVQKRIDSFDCFGQLIDVVERVAEIPGRAVDHMKAFSVQLHGKRGRRFGRVLMIGDEVLNILRIKNISFLYYV